MEIEDDNKLIDTVESIGGLKIEIWSSDFQHALDGHPEVTLSKIQDPQLGTIYFCVVVRVLGQGKGKLETAYEADYIKTGTVLFSQGGKNDR